MYSEGMDITALLGELPDSIRYNRKTYYLSFFRADGTWYIEYVNNQRSSECHTLVYVERSDFASALKELARRLRQGNYIS
jgi:hypothetical protein